MKVIIYGRVSTLSQDVDRQIEELKNYCKLRGYEVTKVFTETISGIKTRKQRKEINQLMEFVSQERDVKGVLVWELSRLGRNTLDVLEIIKDLTERKIWVYSKKEDLCTLNQDGTENNTTKLTLTILSGVSTLERETILSRSISGMRKSVSDGKWLGGKFLPYGYKRQEKKLVIDEEESEVIRLIFDLYLSGNGTQKISNELNRRKIPTRYNKSVKSVTINHTEKKGTDFTWKDGTVYSILTNPLYIGQKIGKGKIEGLKLTSPPIISEEVFSMVQEKLSSTVKKTTKFFYLFEKVIKCGVCGRNYYPHKRVNNKDNRYICLSKRYKETCCNYGISIPKLQDGVWSTLRHNDEEINNILRLNNNTETLDKEISQLEELKNTLEDRIERVERQEKNLVELYIEEKINKEIYNQKYSVIVKEKTDLKNEITGCISELNLKRNYKLKQSKVEVQLRGIKDNKRILKRTIENVIVKIVVYPILTHNLEHYTIVNKQDRFVCIDVFTYINKNTPITFIISQRSDIIIKPQVNEYDRQSYGLEIGKGRTNFVEEEEEQYLDLRELYHLKSLD